VGELIAKDSVSSPSVGEQASNQEEKIRSPLGHRQTNRVMWVAVALAVIVALAYVMIELGVLAVGPATGPAGIVYTAAGGYLLGGLLILAHRRWLWMIGAGINALVILLFVSAYQGQPAIFFSPGGLVTKTAQVLFEVCLIYLIVTYQRPKKRRERG
jgi:hypothetical protein